jgi:hypothetical protein
MQHRVVTDDDIEESAQNDLIILREQFVETGGKVHEDLNIDYGQVRFDYR